MIYRLLLPKLEPLISACFLLYWLIEYQLMLVTLFSVFCSWDKVTQRTQPLNYRNHTITIRIATITVFNTQSLTHPQELQSSSLLAAASLITASWQRIARRKVITAISDERHSVFQTRIVFYFSIYLTHYVRTFSFWRYFFHLSALKVLLYYILSCSRTLLSCELPSVIIHKYRTVRLPWFLP